MADDAAQDVSYWCHHCEEPVGQLLDAELKCPACGGDFIEEMTSPDFEPAAGGGTQSDGSLSLLSPILLGMMGNRLRRSRLHRAMRGEDSDSDRELENFIRRRHRAVVLRMIQGVRDDDGGAVAGSDESEQRREAPHRERQRRVSLIISNGDNEAIIVQGTFGGSTGSATDNGDAEAGTSSSGVAFGDYFLGHGLDLLLQRLAESDLSRYGTPPAKKEAVKALPSVAVKEPVGCSVCLEDLDAGDEAREMPCQHKFHGACILPWLELHSTCPVCRFQLPAEDSKDVPEPSTSGGGDGTGSSDTTGASVGDRRGSGRSWGSLQWALSELFSSTESANDGSSSSSPPPPPSAS